jgi:hypothetical protein
MSGVQDPSPLWRTIRNLQRRMRNLETSARMSNGSIGPQGQLKGIDQDENVRFILGKLNETGDYGVELFDRNGMTQLISTGDIIKAQHIIIVQPDATMSALDIRSLSGSWINNLVNIYDWNGLVQTAIKYTGQIVSSLPIYGTALFEAQPRVSLDVQINGIQFGPGGDVPPDIQLQWIATGTLAVGANQLIVSGRGPTSSRPLLPACGAMWYDTTLMKPIWGDPSNQWRDATGTLV